MGRVECGNDSRMTSGGRALRGDRPSGAMGRVGGIAMIDILRGVPRPPRVRAGRLRLPVLTTEGVAGATMDRRAAPGRSPAGAVSDRPGVP